HIHLSCILSIHVASVPLLVLCIRFAFFLMFRLRPISTLFPYTTLFRSVTLAHFVFQMHVRCVEGQGWGRPPVLKLSNQEPEVLRSEEHTSELQSRFDLVCRLLREKKKSNTNNTICFATA